MKNLGLSALAYLWEKILQSVATAATNLAELIGAETNRATTAEGALSSGKMDKSAYPQVLTAIDVTVQEGTSAVKLSADTVKQPGGQSGTFTLTLPIASETTGGVMPKEAYTVLMALKAWYEAGGGDSGGGGDCNIGIATLEDLGLVKSSEDMGKVYVELNGEMSLVGWDTVQTACLNFASAITTLEQTVNSHAGALAKIVTSPDGNIQYRVMKQQQYDNSDKLGIIDIVG